MNTTHHGPEMAQDAFLPHDAEQAARQLPSGSHWSLRLAIEAQIDRLITFLDDMDLDFDPDLEPSLGFLEANISASNDDFDPRSAWLDYTDEGAQTVPQGSRNDCEADEDNEDVGDDEDGHDFEYVDGRPIPTEACGRAVLL